MNAVQGLDDLWKTEVAQVDSRMKESLRTKAQMSDRDIEKCFQPFTEQLLQSQSRQKPLSFRKLRSPLSHAYFSTE